MVMSSICFNEFTRSDSSRTRLIRPPDARHTPDPGVWTTAGQESFYRCSRAVTADPEEGTSGGQ